MNRLFIFIFFFVPVLLFNGCEEDALDEPSSVQLKVSMKNLNSTEKTTFNGGKPMQIKAGQIAIEGIEFDGRRENAKDYYFSKTFEKGLIGYLEKGELNQNVSFDIPQGSYYPAKIKLHLNAINSPGGLTLYGAYNHPVFEETELEFAFFDNKETIEITIQNLKGNKKVLFDKGKSKTLEIQLNLNSVFAQFNPKRLEAANASQQENKRLIIISKEQNQELYYDLVGRIEKSTKAILK